MSGDVWLGDWGGVELDFGDVGMGLGVGVGKEDHRRPEGAWVPLPTFLSAGLHSLSSQRPVG